MIKKGPFPTPEPTDPPPEPAVLNPQPFFNEHQPSQWAFAECPTKGSLEGAIGPVPGALPKAFCH